MSERDGAVFPVGSRVRIASADSFAGLIGVVTEAVGDSRLVRLDMSLGFLVGQLRELDDIANGCLSESP